MTSVVICIIYARRGWFWFALCRLYQLFQSTHKNCDLFFFLFKGIYLEDTIIYWLSIGLRFCPSAPNRWLTSFFFFFFIQQKTKKTKTKHEQLIKIMQSFQKKRKMSFFFLFLLCKKKTKQNIVVSVRQTSVKGGRSVLEQAVLCGVFPHHLRVMMDETAIIQLY